MTPLRIVHPAAACLERLRTCGESFEKAEAVFMTFEMLMRFDALVLASCALREGLPLSDVARGRLMAARFSMGDWLGLLESLVKTAGHEPFKSLRAWLQEAHRSKAGSRVQRLVTLRNLKAHNDRRVDRDWHHRLVEEAEELLHQVIALHPPLADITVSEDGRLTLTEPEADITGILFQADPAASPARLHLFKGTSSNQLHRSSADGGEQASRECFESLVRMLSARVPALEKLDARGDPAALKARFDSATLSTIRHTTDLRWYRPYQTIERDEPSVFFDAFVRGETPMLLIEGPEGAGKSTWLCRIAEDRLAAGLPVLFETSSRLRGTPPQALAETLFIEGDLSDALERLALSSPDGRVVVIIDDVAGKGNQDTALLGCLRWAEATGNRGGVRLVAAARSEHVQAWRTAGSPLPTAYAHTFLLPPLAKPELTALAERLPVACPDERPAVLVRRRELARSLALAPAATLRRPAFATAALESCHAADTSVALSVRGLYARLLDTDIHGADETGSRLWPKRGSIVAAVAKAILAEKNLFVSLDAVERMGVPLLNPLNGERQADYEALLRNKHLAEKNGDLDVTVGFDNSKLFECVAARLHKSGNVPALVAGFCASAGEFPAGLGAAAFLIAETWSIIDPEEMCRALSGVEPARRVELLTQLAAVDPESFLRMMQRVRTVCPGCCLEAVATLIHFADIALAVAAAGLLRDEPARSPEAVRARYLHVRALYENDDYAGVEREVAAMAPPVDPFVRALAAEAAASCAEWEKAEAAWRSVLADLQPDETAARGYALRGLGYIVARRGDPAAGEALLRESLTLLEGADSARPCSEALGELAEVLAAVGRFDEARECLERSYLITERTGYLTGLGIVEGLLGRLAADQQLWTEAEDRLRKAMDIHERVGNRWRCAWTFDQLARVQDATGRKDEAAFSRAAAAKFYAEIGLGSRGGETSDQDFQRMIAELSGI